MDGETLDGAIRAVQGGDREAFALIIQRLRPALTAHVRAAGVADRDLDDVVQQAFLQAWRALPRLRDPRRIRGWLLAIASNLVRDLHQRRGREREVMTTMQRREVQRAVPGGAALERVERLERLLPGLRAQEREVLALRFERGMNCNEIAAALGRNPATVRSVLHRALNALRAGLNEEVQR